MLQLGEQQHLIQYKIDVVPIVLTSPIVRIYFKKLIDQFYPNVVVLSFSEIDTQVQIQALGNIAV